MINSGDKISLSNTAPFQLIGGDCLGSLRRLPSDSVQMCVTSPPYWGLRNYATNLQVWGGNSACDHSWRDPDHNGGAFCDSCRAWQGELGLEPTPNLFIDHLVLIFRELRRVLKSNGTLWVNLGDTYWGGKGLSGSQGREHQQLRVTRGESLSRGHSHVGGKSRMRPQDRKHPEIKPKDLAGIPWMAAFALRRDGWYLRQDIIWSKPNPMPESVKDRCTKSHEYLFLLSKSKTYQFDNRAIEEAAKHDGRKSTLFKGSKKYDGVAVVPGQPAQNFHSRARERWRTNEKGEVIRNKRSVWTVPTAASKTSHTAVFPEKLVEPCVLAGSKPGDVVLDIFSGTATTGAVALTHDRRYIGIELNPEYLEASRERLIKLID